LIAGVRIVGDGKDSTWQQLCNSILLTRKLGNAGHALWSSRGVLDVFSNELKAFYRGHVSSPQFPRGWRKSSIPLFRAPLSRATLAGQVRCYHSDVPRGKYRMIGFDGKIMALPRRPSTGSYERQRNYFFVQSAYRDVELIIDRREEMMRPRRPAPY
jgi:hypothetical protein